MKWTRFAACLMLLASAGSVAFAQNPFAGTWKLNPAKSHLTGAKISFGPAAQQAIQLTAGGSQYSFRVDGKPYRMATGDIAVWKQVDPSTWVTSYRKPDGKLLDTGSWALSADGQTLTAVTTGSKPDGTSFTNTTIYSRTAGSGGLMGSWKSISVKLSSPGEIVLGAYGLGGISFAVPAMKMSLLANFDGGDVVPKGPDVPPQLTVSVARTGPSSFRLIRKLNGDAIYSAVYTVAADGKTMMQVGNARGDPSQTAVWEKQ